MTPPEDENHQKAQARALEMETIIAKGTPPDESNTPEDDRPGDAVVVVALHGTIDVVFSENIMRVAMGDPAVCDVSVTGPRTLKIKGVSRGKTTLLAWLVSGKRESKLIDVR